MKKLDKQTQHMCKCIEEAGKAVGTKVKTEVTRAYDAFVLNKEDEIVKVALAAARKIGLRPKLVSTGGGSDTNLLNKAGIPAVNLSVGYDKVHTTQEQIKVKDLTAAAKLAVEIVKVNENH